MKEKIMLKKQLIVKCMAVFLFILLALWIFGLLADISRTKTEDIFLTPLITDKNGWDIYIPENGSHREITTEEVLELEPDKVFYLSRILTEEQKEAGYTFLKLDIMRPCAVFLDGELLYTNCPQSDMRIDMVSFPKDYTVTPSAPGECVRCSLPADYAGRNLTIATTYFAASMPGMPGIMLSSNVAESELLIGSISRELMPAAGFAVLTLFLSGIWLFAIFQGSWDYPSLLLILAALIQMLFHLRQFEFLSPSSYAMDSPLALFVPIAEFLLPQIWLLLQIKDYKNRLIYGCILGVSAFISLILPFTGLFGIPFYSSFLESNQILYCPLAALLFFVVYEAIKKRTAFLLCCYTDSA